MKHPLKTWHKILSLRVSQLRDAESCPPETFRVRLKHVVDLVHVGAAMKFDPVDKISDDALRSLMDLTPRRAAPEDLTKLTTDDAGHARRGYSETGPVPGKERWWELPTKFQAFASHAKKIVGSAGSKAGIHLTATASDKRFLDTLYKLLGLRAPTPKVSQELDLPTDEHEKFAALVNWALRTSGRAHPKMTLPKYVAHAGGLSQMLADLEVALGERDQTQNPRA